MAEAESSGRCPALLMTGDALHGHTPYLAPALLHRLEHLPVTVIDIASLFEHSARATEEACIHVSAGRRPELLVAFSYRVLPRFAPGRRRR